MLILFVVLLGIAVSQNTNVTPSVEYDIQPSTNVIIGEDYNLTCIVKGQHIVRTIWLKNGTKLENQANDTTREMDTLRVTYRIKSFSTLDIGNYSCTVEWKYQKNGKVQNLHGEVLKLDYRPGQREDPVEVTKETEQENTPNKTSARPVTVKPQTTALADRHVCKLIKIDRSYNNNYRAGDVLTIPKNRLLTNYVLTIKVRIQHRYDQHDRWDAYDRYDQYDQWPYDPNARHDPYNDPERWRNSHQQRNGHMHKRVRRRSNESNIDRTPKLKGPSFNDDPNEKVKSQGDTAAEQIPLKNNAPNQGSTGTAFSAGTGIGIPNITEDTTKIDMPRKSSTTIHDRKYDKERPGNYPNKPENGRPKTNRFKMLSIEKQNGSNRRNDLIDVYIRKSTMRGEASDWGVSGTLNKPFNKGGFQLEKNTDLKLQMVYNPGTQSLEIITPHTTRSITVPSDDLRNLTQISIGDDINRQGITITIEYISICQPVKPSISLTVEVKKEALNLICTATGPPFLTGYWKKGGQRLYSGTRLVKERLNEKDALQTLTLTLILSPSELQIKEYSCHVSSTSSGDTEVIKAIKLRGDDYSRDRDRGGDCQGCDGGDDEDDNSNYNSNYNNNYNNYNSHINYNYNYETAGYKAKKAVSVALGVVCIMFSLILLAQFTVTTILKRHIVKKVVVQAEEEELSSVTKLERRVETYKSLGLYDQDLNLDYDTIRKENKIKKEGEGGDKKEGEGADKTEENKENNDEEREN